MAPNGNPGTLDDSPLGGVIRFAKYFSRYGRILKKSCNVEPYTSKI